MKVSEGLSTGTFPHISADRYGTPRPEGFRLAGPSRRLDPRVHAYRSDIADVDLAGQLFAPHYARAEACSCSAEATMVRASPSDDAPAVSQLAHGEGFALIDRTETWGWGRCTHDDYVGYVRAEQLGPVQQPTHRVIVPIAPVFSAPDIKAPSRGRRWIGSRVGGAESEGFLRIDAGYLHLRHVAPLDDVEPDWVAVGERMIGAPYLWGGRGAGGIDCSGLVQRALEFAGIAAPRDSDMQREAIGEPIDDGAPLLRGDLIFFPGHVGIMVDGEQLLHANAFWMRTMTEPLADVVGRLAPTHAQPITARRRIAS